VITLMLTGAVYNWGQVSKNNLLLDFGARPQ
jgi:hypothetical protein